MSSFVLKIIAVITMFIDHLGYTIFGKFSYLNYIGRISFPIFAFQISEGYIHTKNLKKYFMRREPALYRGSEKQRENKNLEFGIRNADCCA